MKPTTAIVALAALVLGLGVLSGCETDREVSHTSRTEIRHDGTVRQSQQSVRESPDGAVTTERKTSVTH